MTFQDGLNSLLAGKSFSRKEAETFLGIILDDEEIGEVEVASALTAVTVKGPTVEEILGFVKAMRQRMKHVKPIAGAIDTCGTGGDGKGAFNISTAASFLLAAGGVMVAKHGNRNASSLCGSADVLEALQIPIDYTPAKAAQVLSKNGFVFLFAQAYHPALKKLAVVRRQLGFPTVFNLLGPLLNPAAVKRQVIGTFSYEKAKLLADVASHLHYQRALIIVSQDGLDEASLSAPTTIFEVEGRGVRKRTISPQQFGLKAASLSALKGADAKTNARIITAAMAPKQNLSVHQRVIVLNAGLGFYVSGQSASIASGVKKAIEVLGSGAAAAKLSALKA